MRPFCRSHCILLKTARGAFVSLLDNFCGKLPSAFTSPKFENNKIQPTPPIAELLIVMGAAFPSTLACLGDFTRPWEPSGKKMLVLKPQAPLLL